MTSFGAAIAALRARHVRTDGSIMTHRYPLEDYAEALDAVANDSTVHNAVIVT